MSDHILVKDMLTRFQTVIIERGFGCVVERRRLMPGSSPGMTKWGGRAEAVAAVLGAGGS